MGPLFLFLKAKVAFERKDFQKAEALYLQAERPDLIAIAYKVSCESFDSEMSM